MTNCIPLAEASSPSGWAIQCIADGATAIGIFRSKPSTRQAVDRADTSIRKRGLMRMLNYQQYMKRSLQASIYSIF